MSLIQTRTGRAKSGVHDDLEEQANEILKAFARTLAKNDERRDWLTRWKQYDRWSREVYTRGGTPDPALRQGIFIREANPRDLHLNSRIWKSSRTGGDPAP